MSRTSFPLAIAIALLFPAAHAAPAPAPAARPNILWLVTEDIAPNLGCYGDPDAVTPRLDALAARGLRFRTAWSNAPVCAPARTTIITGCLANTLGAEHMRSFVHLPDGVRPFPAILRAAGYYCTNNAKEDYNVPGEVSLFHSRAPNAKNDQDVQIHIEGQWNESSKKAHYRNRQPGQPFFAVFNFEITHEGQIRSDKSPLQHDPAKIHLPPCHPDTPESRRDWARYHDHITRTDTAVGRFLDDLTKEGLQDDTIVIFYGDNGPGMPRFKRFPGNAGLHVPLIVHVPEKWQHLAPEGYAPGAASDRLVSFVDLAPTVLSLAGRVPLPAMQGRAFMGPQAKPGPDFLFGFRGRMDERIDLVRSATDGRFSYLRNFLPHLPHGQHVAYQFQTPTTRVWKELFDQGKLPPAQASFWQPRAPEELYDLTADPGETRNLAADPAHAAVLEKFRKAVHDQIIATRDPGLLPEAEMHRLAGKNAPATFAADPKRFPVEEILRAAELASDPAKATAADLLPLLAHPHPGVRWWAATGFQVRGPAAAEAAREPLRKAFHDESPSVNVAAAAALAAVDSERAAALVVLKVHANPRDSGTHVAVAALNALDHLGPKAGPLDDFLAALPPVDSSVPPRFREYPKRLIETLRNKR